MLHQGMPTRTRPSNSQSGFGHSSLRGQVVDGISIDAGAFELLPELSMRPLTLRFSLAYYASAFLTGLPLLMADLLALVLANTVAVAIVTSFGGGIGRCGCPFFAHGFVVDAVDHGLVYGTFSGRWALAD